MNKTKNVGIFGILDFALVGLGLTPSLQSNGTVHVSLGNDAFAASFSQSCKIVEVNGCQIETCTGGGFTIVTNSCTKYPVISPQ